MKISSLFRMCAVAGFLSSIFIILEQLFPPGHASDVAGLLSPALGLFVLTGLYAFERRQAGGLGVVGYVVSFFGLAMVVGLAFASAFVLPFMTPRAAQTLMNGPTGPIFLLSSIIFLVGFVLFTVATIKAAVLPKLAPALMIVGYLPIVVTPFVPHLALLVGAVVFGAGMAWICLPLWSPTQAPVVGGHQPA